MGTDLLPDCGCQSARIFQSNGLEQNGTDVYLPSCLHCFSHSQPRLEAQVVRSAGQKQSPIQKSTTKQHGQRSWLTKMETAEKSQMFLLQATYSSWTWIYRTKKDPDDFKRPPDLLSVFQELGAKFHGIWYSFGEYDLVAIAEVPGNVNVAAVIIAMRSGWDGKAFDKVNVSILLNQDDAALACGRAASGLARSRDASKDGPLQGSTMDYSSQDFSKAENTAGAKKIKDPS